MGSNLGQVRAVRPDPSLSRHIGDLFPSLEELVAAREAAVALLAQPGWTLLIRLLDAEIATIDATLDSGRVLESKADYAAAHGRRGGLRAPEQVMRLLVERADARLAEQAAKHEQAEV